MDLLVAGTRRFSFDCSFDLPLSPFSASASAATEARVLRALPGTGGGLGLACLPFAVGLNSGGMLLSRISAAEGGSARLMSSSRGTRAVGLLVRVNVMEGGAALAELVEEACVADLAYWGVSASCATQSIFV